MEKIKILQTIELCRVQNICFHIIIIIITSVFDEQKSMERKKTKKNRVFGGDFSCAKRENSISKTQHRITFPYTRNRVHGETRKINTLRAPSTTITVE